MRKNAYILALLLFVATSVSWNHVSAATGDEAAQITYISSQKEVIIKMFDHSAATLEVYNILGSKVLSVSLDMSTSRVSLSRLAEGQYVLKLSTPAGNLLAVKKFAVY